MSLEKIYYEPIKVKKVAKDAFIAETKYWMDKHPLRIEVNQFGQTEKSAEEKLVNFLNGTGEAILINASGSDTRQL